MITPKGPTDYFAEMVANAAEYRADIARLRTNIAHVREYAEGKAAQFNGNSREFRRGMAAAYGDVARKLVVAEHADFEKT